jgi:hypothetical protein
MKLFHAVIREFMAGMFPEGRKSAAATPPRTIMWDVS